MTLSDVKVLCHDASTNRTLGLTRIGEVVIGNNVFVGAKSVILPNVHIGDNVVIGSGSIVTRDIPCNSIAVGNPCRVIGTFDDYIERQKTLITRNNTWEKLPSRLTNEDKEKIRQELSNGIGFIL